MKIDLNLEFLNFTSLDDEKLKQILAWRNAVAKYMRTSHQISLEEHFNFVKALRVDENKKYFLLKLENLEIGVVTLINLGENLGEFGLYQNPNLRGFGFILMKGVIKYARNLGFLGIQSCVKKSNSKALSLYLNESFEIFSEDEDYFYVKLSLNGGGGLAKSS